MKNKNLLWPIMAVVLITGLYSCKEKQQDYKKVIDDPALYSRTVKHITDCIVHDIFSPPQATRIYAYSTIAGYEAMAPFDSAYRDLQGQVHGIEDMPRPDNQKQYDYHFASMLACAEVGRSLIFSEDSITVFMDSLKVMAKDAGMPEDIFNNSVAYGQAVAKAVIMCAKTDNYDKTRSAEKYTVTNQASRWKPTPPGYMQAIEPHWNEIRTFVIDSCSQFKPVRPPKFDTAKGSDFYKMEYAVYKTGRDLTKEEQDTANFWDCNPYKLNLSGHVMFATKKISPPGHWMNIVAIITKKAHADFSKTVYTYARAAITLADAVISCWDEKYRGNQLRPETYINQYIDPDWRPYLQTPPFPDYTSAHSVMSAAVALVLTDIYGDHFAFHDPSEMEYGAGQMDFSSIQNAADVAAVSRFYGGIHNKPAVYNGMDQGQQVAKFIISKLKMKDDQPALSAAR